MNVHQSTGSFFFEAPADHDPEHARPAFPAPTSSMSRWGRKVAARVLGICGSPQSSAGPQHSVRDSRYYLRWLVANRLLILALVIGLLFLNVMLAAMRQGESVSNDKLANAAMLTKVHGPPPPTATVLRAELMMLEANLIRACEDEPSFKADRPKCCLRGRDIGSDTNSLVVMQTDQGPLPIVLFDPKPVLPPALEITLSRCTTGIPFGSLTPWSWTTSTLPRLESRLS